VATLHFTPLGILFRTATAIVAFGEDTGKTDAEVPMIGVDDRFSVKDVFIKRHPGGTTIALPDATVEYFPKTLPSREAKKYPCNVLILGEHRDATKIIKAVQPRLAILHNGNLEHARDIQKALGIQTIAANPGVVVNLNAYNALSSQQRLGAFTQES
jgi:hypothetical protein